MSQHERNILRYMAWITAAAVLTSIVIALVIAVVWNALT